MSLFEFSESKVMGNPTVIHLRLDLSEKERLKEYAENEDLNLSNFLRKCINFYIDSLEGNVNADEDNNTSSNIGVYEDIDYLLGYQDTERIFELYCSVGDWSNRKDYRKDAEGYEYFTGVHDNFLYDDPIELRRSPKGVVEFRLFEDNRGFVIACDDICKKNDIITAERDDVEKNGGIEKFLNGDDEMLDDIHCFNGLL